MTTIFWIFEKVEGVATLIVAIEHTQHCIKLVVKICTRKGQ